MSTPSCEATSAALASGLAGCDAYNKSFNASFDKSTHDSCVTSAQTHGAAADVAEKYCTCVVAQLDKLFSVSIGDYSFQGKSFIANNAPPSVPTSLPGVRGARPEHRGA